MLIEFEKTWFIILTYEYVLDFSIQNIAPVLNTVGSHQ